MSDDNKKDDDLTPTASPLAKRPESSTRHVAMQACPYCEGLELTHPECKVCENQRYSNDPIKLSTWDLRKTLKDYIKS